MAALFKDSAMAAGDIVFHFANPEDYFF